MTMYGTFAGCVDPHNVAEVTQVLEYAMDRVADELLTVEQINGLLNLAIDALNDSQK